MPIPAASTAPASTQPLERHLTSTSCSGGRATGRVDGRAEDARRPSSRCSERLERGVARVELFVDRRVRTELPLRRRVALLAKLPESRGLGAVLMAAGVALGL